MNDGLTRVFLVEDTPRHVRVICDLLRKDSKINPDITIAKSLADTLSTLKKNSNHDVMLLDLEIEDSSGLDTLVRVIKMEPGFPVLVITSVEDETLAIQAISLGAQDYLIKGDFTTLQLSTRIHFALERHRLRTDVKKYSSAASLFAKAFQQADDPIVITDADGNIEYANQAFCADTQYSLPEIIGQNPRMFKSGTHSDSFYKFLWDTIKAGKPWHGELINKRKSGELHEQELAISPIKDDDGQISHFVAFLKDISLLKQTEVKLAKIEREDARSRWELEKLRIEMETQRKLMGVGYTPISAKMAGLASLRERIPTVFKNMKDKYGDLLEKYLEALPAQREKPHAEVVRLVEQIGEYACGPRDVIDIHIEAVSEKCHDAHPERVKAMTIEGRLLALEVMGNLVDFYRRGGSVKADKQ